MSEAQTILKLIEEVSPDDTAKLDEIDARTWAIINGFEIERMDKIGSAWAKPRNIHHADYPRYTRSRDALKAIRPEGWAIIINSYAEFSRCHIQREDRPFVQECNYTWEPAPTEELAELHVIIQAIEWERTHG